jgi:hypothetical protein
MSPIEFGSPQAPPVSPVSMPSGSRSADGTPPGSRSGSAPSDSRSVAQIANDVVPQTTTPAAAARWGNSDRDSAQNVSFIDWLREKVGLGRQRKGEDSLTFVAVPLFVGFSVYVGAMAVRRRRNNKKPKDPRDRD